MKQFDKYSKEQVQFYDGTAPKLLIDLIKTRNPKSLADLGCGDGAILFHLQQKGLLKKNDCVVAIDLSETRLERVKKYIANVKTICCDVCDVKQLKDNKFDVVISTAVIEHVENDGKLLKEIYRVFKSGGYLYISSVVKKWYGWWIYTCNGKITCDPTHLREYKSSEEFNKLLKYNKFKIGETHVYQFTPSLKNAFKRLMVKYNIISENNARSTKKFDFFSNIRIHVPGYCVIEVIARK